MTLSIVESGIWFYANSIEKPVDIISLNYDWWFELAKADDQLEPDEKPEPLNQLGVLYYVRFKHATESDEPTWPDSVGCQTIEEAKKIAQSKSPSQIVWSMVGT
ncbi:MULTISPECIES: hypothetical protein [Alteromonadales]|uniref:Uncharacterized protein n=2 Tax=Alteromonadales TaxID=135622 RepID=A0A6L7I3A5_9GAMM|nr:MULTISPECIES: hypothetical protein [Alteromonadales]MXR69818.1 hypothetical protein [Shewanella insulae]OHU94959.1 hypothetical protein BIW53_13155 [Pseudoalteromonas byunsanensis]